MSHFLYILQSQIKDTYYTGVSSKPETRCFFHNHDSQGYTRRYRPWKLAYTHAFATCRQALAAEQKVKSWKSKKMLRLLIEGEIDIVNYVG